MPPAECFFVVAKRHDLLGYLKVKIDGTDTKIFKGRLVEGPKINQYVGTVPSIFELL